MGMKSVIARAKRGFREDLRLYLVAVTSLSVAFLFLGAVLLLVSNVQRASGSLSDMQRMTVFLKADAKPVDVERLSLLLRELPEVREVVHVSEERAKAEMMSQMVSEDALSAVPSQAFPASLEISLVGALTQERRAHVAAQIGRFGVAEEVETYDAFFGQLDALSKSATGLAVGLALLVLLCVLAVVGNTIRLAIAARREEIEVMRLCGATQRFVRGPFVIEGLVQGGLSAVVALVALGLSFVLLRDQLDQTVGALVGMQAVFLSPAVVVGFLAVGLASGAAGSVFSLRRYLSM